MQDLTIITLADQGCDIMARVMIQSLRELGCAGAPFDAVVYDFGLNAEFRVWADKHKVEVRSIEETPRILLPLSASADQRRFDLWVCKTWCIMDAAKRNPNGTVLFLDSDMIIILPIVEEIVRTVDGHCSWVAVRDPFTLGSASMYVRAPENAHDPAFWIKWFGKDLHECPTWNVGLLAADAKTILNTYENWQVINYLWQASSFRAEFNTCIDQMAFSISASEMPVFELPTEFNVTRPIWTCQPEIIPRARVIHLTGSIKPGSPAGELHPMTLTWCRYAQQLAQEGLLE